MDDGLPPLREVIAAHELQAKRSLGQNFLLDLNLTGRIARAAGSLTDHDVLEVGPGPGGLTRALLANGARRVVAIERDPRCLPALRDIAAAYPGRLKIIEGDALRVNVLGHLTTPYRIVANLPYNVGTALLTRWLLPSVWPPDWSSLTLMFQREVAERITAKPGSKSYGRLSVLSHWRSDAQRIFDIPPQAFTPPPKVTSSVVHITSLGKPRHEADAEALQRVTAAAFGQRRKMLRAALKSMFSENDLREAEIDPTARAETLSLAAFCRLARRL